MEREATSGYHLLNSPLVRSVQIPSGKCRLRPLCSMDQFFKGKLFAIHRLRHYS